MTATSDATSPARELRALRPGGRTETRADRARSEPMAVLPVGGGRYDVVTHDDHVYTVDLTEGRCTCPDYRHRDAHCKHRYRVELDVEAGRVPAPGQREAVCADCGGAFFASEDAPDPVYCSVCTLETGEYVVDRETGDLVVVVRTTDRRADEVVVGDHTVASHPTNAAYDDADVVCEVVYPLPVGVDPDAIRATQLKRYAFPRGRLRRHRR